jgi:ABC-type branched-subunit amino acid transport system substrate-binding protein
MRFRLLAFGLLLAATLTACSGGPGDTPWTRGEQPPTAAQTVPSTLDMGIGWDPSAPERTPAPQTETAQFNPTLPPTTPVKVALLLPLSGPSADIGESLLNAAQLALFDVGAVEFELIPRDTGGTAAGAASAAQAALAQGAQLILGPLFADEVRAVKPVAAAADVNIISFTTDWRQAGGNSFVMGFLPFGQIQRVMHYARSQNIRTIGAIIPQSDYGNAVLSALNAAAPQLGLEIVDVLRFTPGQTANMGPAIERFARYQDRQGNASASMPFDAVFLPVGSPDAQTIANFLSYYDLPAHSVRRLGMGLWDDGAVLREANLAGGWFAAPDPRARALFERKYNDTYGAQPHRLASLGYDATALAAVLAKSAGQTPRPSFSLITATPNNRAFRREAILNPNGFAGIDGIFRFRADGLADRGLAILELRATGIQVRDPAPKSFTPP